MPTSERKAMLALPFCDTVLTARKPRDPAYPTELKTIGDHLRKRRLDLNLLQKEVAQRIGADTTSLWAWETNRKAPAVRFYPSIIEFLGYYPWQNESSTFGQRIKQFRYSRGLSQEQLSSLLKVDPGTVSDWEAERTQPSGENHNRVENLLDDLSRH
jgi:transcriptional regulator with XRE-family HTH domain